MKKLISAILCAAMLLTFSSCTQNVKQEYSFFGMNTLMAITVFDGGSLSPEAVNNITKEKCEELEKVFDALGENSEVYRFNNRISRDFKVSSTLNAALTKALLAYDITDGAFDISVMPLLSLWGFDNGNYGLPKHGDIENALKSVGSKKLTLSGGVLSADADVKISMGGIAKGFFGDELIKNFKDSGVTAVFSLGGNIVTLGQKKDGSPFSIAIKDPKNDSATFCTVKVGGETSVVTSGGYERYFEYEGKKYHHILDPKTGYPAESGILSVTVIGKDGALCDAFSTGLFVLGREKAAEIMKSQSGFDYVILCDDGKIYTSLSEEALTLSKDADYTVVR